MTTDLYRIETKVDGLTLAINRLVLFEERQAVQATAIAETARALQAVEEKISTRVDTLEDKLAEKIASNERKLDQWINRGIGIWALAATLVGLWKVFSPWVMR